jgi:hypothetical protein
LRTRTRADALYVALVAALGALALLPWWSSRILPMLDYAQFLTFVRAFQDIGQAGSPFHGTYEIHDPLAPLALPVALTSLLSRLGGLETDGCCSRHTRSGSCSLGAPCFESRGSIGST